MKVKINNDYIIPFVGLKLGVHDFTFNLTDTFFESFDYSLIQKGEVNVTLRLDKKENMMIGDYSFEGVVENECDRCGDPVKVPISGESQLIYKFGTEPSDDESLVIVYPEEFEIDVKDNMLELVTVALPARNVHAEGECNEDMMYILNDYMLVEESSVEDQDDSEEEDEEVDPRWAALRDLKGKSE